MKKISKPVLFTLIFAVGMILYLFVFSGKKAPPVALPKPQGAAQTVTGALQALAGVQQPAAGVDDAKKRAEVYAQMKDITWVRDPFGFPRDIMDKRSEQQTKGTSKLVAIIEGKKGKVAIIDNDIVKKGDMLGSERVYDIADDRIVLMRNGVKRIVTIEEAPSTDVEIKVKKRGR